MTKNNYEKIKKSLMKSLKAGNLEGIKAALEQGADPNSVLDDGLKSNVTALMAACRQGNLEAVKILVERGASIHERTVFGNSALMYAAGSGNGDLMRYLISLGADVKETDKYGYSVLLMAAGSGNLDCVKLCAEYSLSFVEKGFHDLTPLMVAGSIETGRYIVEEQQVNVNAESVMGASALMFAAGGDDFELVQYLVEHGALINAREKDVSGSFGKTALHYAAEKGSLEIVKYLVEHGADTAIKAKYGESALDFAVEGGHGDIVEYLVSGKGEAQDGLLVAALIEAAGRGKLHMVRDLVEKKNAPVDGAGEGGVTALMKAAQSERPDIVEYLISRGASVSLQDAGGRTAWDHVRKEPPKEYENAHEAWCYSNAGAVLDILGKYR